METAIKIDSNVPVPEMGGRKPRGEYAYPMRDMDVGDSFFIPCSPDDRSVVRNRVHTYRAGLQARGHIDKVSLLIRDDALADGTEGLRVWRTA